MARLVDLDQIGSAASHLTSAVGSDSPDSTQGNAANTGERFNPNVGLLSAALVCYPIASQLAAYLDLNSLHDLSRTCRQVRACLLQYHTLLKTQTLHCENENANQAQRLGNALHASFKVWTAYGENGTQIGRITSGKLGSCSRDMVGDCRRCGRTVCRNCIMKPPLANAYKGRLRRLCRTCMKSPLARLTRVPASNIANPHEGTTTYIARDMCNCLETVWLCQTCSQTARSNDTAYIRSWAWRARYSRCGGIGAGLGEGNEGVECGRNHDYRCLGAREVEQEVECDAEELASLEADMVGTHQDHRHWQGSSYMTHEVVGIGGKVKTKVRKAVNVGEVVKEYEDERVSGKFLEREQIGANRSWCSWCARVVPGKKDKERELGSTDSIASEMSHSPLHQTLSIDST